VEGTEGDPAVVTACEAYAGRLYSYCLWLLADEEQAISALVELFVGAQRLGVRLGDPRLSGWLLYAMVRPGCLRASDEQDRPWPADVADSFAWTDGLEWAQREVLELSVRHGLQEQDIALVLGVSGDTVRTRLADARASLGTARAVRTLTPPDCDELAGHLAAVPSAQQGTIVQEHAAQCPTCGARLREAAPVPTRLAHVATPPALRPRILRELADNYPSLAQPVAKALGQTAPPTPRTDPQQPQAQAQPQPPHRRRRRVVVTATCAIIALGVTAFMLTGGGNAERPSSQPAMTGAGANGAQASPVPANDVSTSPSSRVASGPGSSASRGGATTSPTATTVPAGASASPGSSTVPGGTPSPTPSTPASSGSSLGVTWKQSPQTTTITLTVTSGTQVQWSVTVSDNYLHVSQSSGTLTPGQTQIVTVTVDLSLAPHGPWHAKILVDPGNTLIPVNGKGP
jgi:hypothetical protein